LIDATITIPAMVQGRCVADARGRWYGKIDMHGDGIAIDLSRCTFNANFREPSRSGPTHLFLWINAKPGDNLEGAQGIIRCFVSQLLLQNWDFDCAFIDRNEVERVYTHETSQLCKLFERLLISALNNMTIFCIIDGISWFENNERCMNVRIVRLSLRQLVDKLQQNSRGVNLKVFVTSPKRSRSADSWSVPGDRLVMPADVGGNGQGSNVLHMTGATQRIMGSQRGNEPEQWAVGAQMAY